VVGQQAAAARPAFHAGGGANVHGVNERKDRGRDTGEGQRGTPPREKKAPGMAAVAETGSRHRKRPPQRREYAACAQPDRRIPLHHPRGSNPFYAVAAARVRRKEWRPPAQRATARAAPEGGNVREKRRAACWRRTQRQTAERKCSRVRQQLTECRWPEADSANASPAGGQQECQRRGRAAGANVARRNGGG